MGAVASAVSGRASAGASGESAPTPARARHSDFTLDDLFAEPFPPIQAVAKVDMGGGMSPPQSFT